MSHDITNEQAAAIAAKKKAYRDAFDAGSVTMPDLAREYHDIAIDALLGVHSKPQPCPPQTCPTGQHWDQVQCKCVPDVKPCPELPADGRPQPSKGANPDAHTWKSVEMRDDPNLFKVVDAAGINVADQFNSKATADQYIAHFVCDTPPPPPCPPQPCPAGQHWDTKLCKCVVDTPPPVGGVGPYVGTGKQLDTKLGEVKVRHYASGKPDDFTRERTVTGVPYKNYQFIVETTMHSIEHDDTLSLKFGGTHMGSGWFDCGVSFEDGQCCLGTEENHPSTDLCIVTGPNIG